jgi:hypothetical protein
MLIDKETAAEWIRDGKTLLLSGTEEMLTGLPLGDWVGGTTLHFMNPMGGLKCVDKIFVSEPPPGAKLEQIKLYDADHLAEISAQAPDNGFTYLLIPSNSAVLMRYAQESPSYPHQYIKPLIGWVTGFPLEEFGKRNAKVFNGQTGQASDNAALAMHFSLPANKMAHISVVNVFKADPSVAITFPYSGFEVGECFINGKPANLIHYLRENNIDTHRPLIADYSGAAVTVAFPVPELILEDKGIFPAPVFEGVTYYFSLPVDDYVTEFHKQMPKVPDNLGLSFYCLSNYLYSELEGKVIKGIYGPFTFGEIAYQVLNQTMAYLEIKDV